jgi:two-component system sensor histidine kinase DegS
MGGTGWVEQEALDIVLQELLKAIENGQAVINGIAENAQREIEQTKNMHHQCSDLERSIQCLTRTVEKAEAFVGKTGIVLQFIQGDLDEINLKHEDPKQHNLHLKVILAQEEERRRLAREIHDSPAQAMANIVLRAEYCEQLLVHDPAQLSSELEKLKCTVRRTLTDIRKIIFDLRPMVLDDLGLAGGVRRLCEVFRERDKLAVDFLLYGSERRYSRILEVAVFRIIQEALNNVQKHAEASRATVKLELRAERVFAAIQDDGIGFDPEVAAEERERYGLTNMRERAQALQGELQVSSTKGEGTTITVVIPVGEEVLRYGEDKSSHR